jgi:transcriptional regulator with XRE-family HTH domain
MATAKRKPRRPSLGQRIEARREMAGISRLDVASALKISRSTVDAWPNKGVLPRSHLLERLAVMFGCSVGEMLDTPLPGERQS